MQQTLFAVLLCWAQPTLFLTGFRRSLAHQLLVAVVVVLPVILIGVAQGFPEDLLGVKLPGSPQVGRGGHRRGRCLPGGGLGFIGRLLVAVALLVPFLLVGAIVLVIVVIAVLPIGLAIGFSVVLLLVRPVLIGEMCIRDRNR